MVGFIAGLTGARLAARLGVARLLVLTNAVATAGFVILSHLPATGGYSPLLAAVKFVGFGTAGTAFGAMVTASWGADGDPAGHADRAGTPAQTPHAGRLLPLTGAG